MNLNLQNYTKFSMMLIYDLIKNTELIVELWISLDTNK